MLLFYLLLIIIIRLTLSNSPPLPLQCNRTWPEIELFLPLSINYAKKDPRYYEYESCFLRSLLLFWPFRVSNTSIRLLFDAEKANTAAGTPTKVAYEEVVGTFKAVEDRFKPGKLHVSFMNESDLYNRRGDLRQQLMMMYAGLCERQFRNFSPLRKEHLSLLPQLCFISNKTISSLSTLIPLRKCNV